MRNLILAAFMLFALTSKATELTVNFFNSSGFHESGATIKFKPHGVAGKQWFDAEETATGQFLIESDHEKVAIRVTYEQQKKLIRNIEMSNESFDVNLVEVVVKCDWLTYPAYGDKVYYTFRNHYYLFGVVDMDGYTSKDMLKVPLQLIYKHDYNNIFKKKFATISKDTIVAFDARAFEFTINLNGEPAEGAKLTANGKTVGKSDIDGMIYKALLYEPTKFDAYAGFGRESKYYNPDETPETNLIFNVLSEDDNILEDNKRSAGSKQSQETDLSRYLGKGFYSKDGKLFKR